MSAIGVTVKVDQERGADDEVVALETWLRQARIRGLRTRRESRPIRPGEMGAELLPILALVASSTVLAEVIKALHGWLVSRRRKVALELEIGGKKIRIESEGTETVEDLMRRARPLLAIEPDP